MQVELSDEHTRLFSEVEGYSRKLEAYETHDILNAMSRTAEIKTRCDEIERETSVSGERLHQLNDERCALLRQSGGRATR